MTKPVHTVDDSQAIAIVFSKTDCNQFMLEIRHQGKSKPILSHGEPQVFNGMDDVRDYLHKHRKEFQHAYLALDNTYDEFGAEEQTTPEGISHHYMPIHFD